MSAAPTLRPVAATGASAATPGLASTDVSRGPLLWRVERSTDESPSYLVGTIHAGVGAHQLPGVVQSALAGCKALVLEADVRSPDRRRAAALMARRSDTAPASDMLTKSQWRQLSQLLGQSPSGLKMLRPWALYMMLAVRVMPSGAGVDTGLLQAATAAGQRLVFLESTVAPLRILADMPDAGLLAELRLALAAPGQLASEHLRVVAAFRAGDVAALEAMTFFSPSSRRMPWFNERFLLQRNVAWVPLLEKELVQGGVCVGVGAGHLVGRGSLQQLLGARGWRVQRVFSPQTPAPAATSPDGTSESR